MDNVKYLNEMYVSPVDDRLLLKKVKSPKGRVCITDRYMYSFCAYKVISKHMEKGVLYYEVTDTDGYIAEVNSNDVTFVSKNDIEINQGVISKENV